MSMKETSRPSLEQQNAARREAIARQMKKERREELRDWIKDDLVPQLMHEIISQLNEHARQIRRHEETEISTTIQGIVSRIADIISAKIEPLALGLAREIETSHEARAAQIAGFQEIRQEVEISRREQEKEASMARKTLNEFGPTMAEVKCLVKSASGIHRRHYEKLRRRIWIHILLVVPTMIIGVVVSASLASSMMRPAQSTILNAERWVTYTDRLSPEDKRKLEDAIDRIIQGMNLPLNQ